jgi:hypothetical protein
MTLKYGRCVATCLALVACASSFHLVTAQQAKAPDAEAGPHRWTLEEARAHLRLYPRDAYMQYVALQLARREGNLAEVAAELQQRDPLRDPWRQRQDQVDLFSIFSGQLAVQESLQLDALAPDAEADPNAPVDVPVGRGGPRPIRAPGAAAVAEPSDGVPIASLEGPTVKSHPWTEMLAGRKPDVKGLALVAPADYYFVSFRSLNKLLDAADLATLWGAHVFNQANREAKTQLVGDRLREQLAVEETPELRPFYDAVVDEVAIVGSDLFVREGSDVTMLFHAQQPPLLRAKMDQFLATAENGYDDAVRTKGYYQGVEYVHVTTPDRRVHVYSAYPKPELHVRSNSLKALERVLEAIAGHNPGGAKVERLGETDEFRYVRTILKPGAEEEDGLVYLSDRFVRRLMSAQVRLTQRRRQSCYNNLRMIGHAGLMHRTETGHDAGSLAELNASDCAAGEFGAGKFGCPEHGEYTLGSDGVTGVCSHHGYASYLTPCLDVPTAAVSGMEAEAYKMFVEQYNAYWRRFFDPIAIRLQITPERLRAETVVLPLIDNTIYTQLATALGGEVEALDALPVPKRNIFSFAVRLNKARILHEYGLHEFLDAAEPQREEFVAEGETQDAAMALRQLGIGMLNHETAKKALPAPNKNGLSWRVHLLPYIEEQALYSEFHLNEPWDSPHNRQLIGRMPRMLRPANEKLAAEGKTRFVAPRGEGTMFPESDRGLPLSRITDGLSNTIMLVEADDEHAVIWTQPEDIEITAEDAKRDLQIRAPGAFLVVMGDCSLRFLRDGVAPATLTAMLTRGGEETVDLSGDALPVPEGRFNRNRYGDDDAQVFAQLRLGELITRGVGNQIGFHVYDAEPMFDLGLTRFMGMALGSMRGSRMIDDDFLFLFPLLGALNGPVYVSIPAEDREIVDGFLDRLDKWLVELASRQERGFFFSVDQDFYHLPEQDGRQVRAYGFGFGPLKWRFFWSRIDDALYIASKREVLDDIAALAVQGDHGALAGSPRDPGSDAAHALVRIRPQNWDQVLDAYRLGWEENNREACLRNLGPLSGLSRAIAAGRQAGEPITVAELDQYAGRVYDVHHFCPDDGHYEVGADGHSISCSVHGSASEPRQGEAPAASSELGELMRQFSDMRITLTFLEDGLHAVATLERKAEE